jgi:hypothetical protein
LYPWAISRFSSSVSSGLLEDFADALCTATAGGLTDELLELADTLLELAEMEDCGVCASAETEWHSPAKQRDAARQAVRRMGAPSFWNGNRATVTL